MKYVTSEGLFDGRCISVVFLYRFHLYLTLFVCLSVCLSICSVTVGYCTFPQGCTNALSTLRYDIMRLSGTWVEFTETSVAY
jgi:hypothetical protein